MWVPAVGMLLAAQEPARAALRVRQKMEPEPRQLAELCPHWGAGGVFCRALFSQTALVLEAPLTAAFVHTGALGC